MHQELGGYRIHNEWFRIKGQDPLCLVRRTWREFVSDEHGISYDGLWRYRNKQRIDQRHRCVFDRTLSICPVSGESCLSQESLRRGDSMKLSRMLTDTRA